MVREILVFEYHLFYNGIKLREIGVFLWNIVFSEYRWSSGDEIVIGKIIQFCGLVFTHIQRVIRLL